MGPEARAEEITEWETTIKRWSLDDLLSICFFASSEGELFHCWEGLLTRETDNVHPSST
jgi:hypothetical protein